MMAVDMRRAVVIALCLTCGCAGDGEPWSGEPLSSTMLHLISASEGVYPDQSVLVDPANPFALGALADPTVWKIQSNGNLVGAIYAWATACARGATGERQYYTALDLKAIYESAQAPAEELPAIRDRAVRGFQTVLDSFPDSVTYDATGTIAWDLATPCVEDILALGGTVQGGWVIVQKEDGGKRAVRPGH